LATVREYVGPEVADEAPFSVGAAAASASAELPAAGSATAARSKARRRAAACRVRLPTTMGTASAGCDGLL